MTAHYILHLETVLYLEVIVSQICILLLRCWASWLSGLKTENNKNMIIPLIKEVFLYVSEIYIRFIHIAFGKFLHFFNIRLESLPLQLQLPHSFL